MATIQTNDEFKRELIPAGDHLLVLKSCEVKRVKSQYSKDEDGKTDKLMWCFLSQTTKDTEGKPSEYTVFTNTRYGDSKASLTDLLNQMVPDITVETAKELDTDDLLGNKYDARLRHEKGVDGLRVFARHLYLIPHITPAAKARAAKAAEAAADAARIAAEASGEQADPFVAE